MEIPAEPLAEQIDPTAPRTWQLWRPFVGIHRWYFSPGCPPPLRNLDGLAGCVQTSILCAGMGMVAGVLGVVILVATSLLVPGGGFLQMCLLGLAYGIVVVFPLSRWINRTVFWSVAGIVVCVLCYCLLILNAQFLNMQLRAWIGRDGTSYYLRFLHNLAVFAPPMTFLGVFMLGRQRRPLWMLFAVFMSVVVFAFTMVLQSAIRRYWPPVFNTNPVISMTIGAQPVFLSWMLLAIALGMRLWPSLREAEPPVENRCGR